jgi:hypothetical protein
MKARFRKQETCRCPRAPQQKPEPPIRQTETNWTQLKHNGKKIVIFMKK